MSERNLFSELSEGFTALQEQREGRRTLRTHEVELKPQVEIRGDEILALRDRLGMSRAVFARYLRINQRTLENWEQERARPNAQAALLLRLVEQFPDTVQRLAEI